VRELTANFPTFAAKMDAFIRFREAGCHTLLPVDQQAEWAFFTNGDDAGIQRVWAREHGLSRHASLGDILKAQIEEHRADVFYNLDATGWDADFIKSLPGCVRSVIAWHAAPFRNVSFLVYDLVVCNFPSILAAIAKQGCRTEYLFPAYDPKFAPFAARQDRPVDVVFVGGYSRHHRRRAEVLEAVAKLAGEYKIVYHLDRSRLCQVAESPIGRFLPLTRHRRPPAIRAISKATEPDDCVFTTHAGYHTLVDDRVVQNLGVHGSQRISHFRKCLSFHSYTVHASQRNVAVRLYGHRLVEFRRKRKIQLQYVRGMQLIASRAML